MTNPRAEGDAFIAQFTESMEEIGARATRVRDVLRDATATASHPELPVTVTVDASGALADLQFGGGALALDAAALAHAVLDTSRRARRELLRNAETQVSNIMGPDSGSVAVLHHQLNALDVVDEAPPERPKNAQRVVTDLDDDDDEAFVGRAR